MLSPNPASTTISLSVSNRTETLSLQITDMNGKTIKQQLITGDDTKVNVSGLSKGMYIVKVFGSSSMFSEKLVIQR